MHMEISALEPGVMWIALSGRLDVDGTQSIEMAFTAHPETERAAVLVDLGEVDFIASIGMRLLLSNAKALAKRGGKMVLARAQPRVRDVLRTAGIDTLIPLYDDVDQACSDLRSAVPS
jgi:anti-sigma B factor antagonist